MSERVTIRPAVSEDFGLLLQMLVEMHAEIGVFPISVDRVAARVLMVIDKGMCLIAMNEEGHAIGTIGLIGEKMWYSDHLTLSDTWIFVRKGKRCLRAFAELVKGARTIADQMQIPLVLCLYALKDHDRKARLFERHARRIMTGYLYLEAGGDFLAKGEG